MGNVIKKFVALACGMSLLGAEVSWAQFKDGRKIAVSRLPWKRAKAKTEVAREKAKLYVSRREEADWVPIYTIEPFVNREIGGQLFDEGRGVDMNGYGVSQKQIFRWRHLGDKTQQIRPMSRPADVQDFFEYQGWPYYISMKNELRGIDASEGNRLGRRVGPSLGRAFKNYWLFLAGGFALGSLASWGNHFPMVDTRHMPVYIMGFVTMGGVWLVFTAREMLRNGERYFPAPNDFFTDVIVSNVSAIRAVPEKKDVAVDYYDKVKGENVTGYMSNLIGNRGPRSALSCAQWLAENYP